MEKADITNVSENIKQLIIEKLEEKLRLKRNEMKKLENDYEFLLKLYSDTRTSLEK